jgi:4a-hydroxytetrahydrobiopterin dehydratase
MSHALEDRIRVPIPSGSFPLAEAEIPHLLKDLPHWERDESRKKICRLYVMKNFKEAVALIVRIKTWAEKLDHHPDLHLTDYRKLRIELTTHSTGGISINDFILAKKIESLPKQLKTK